ncbi:reverse transcriptase domain-containing protein, partial [Tanacetum coccineum]
TECAPVTTSSKETLKEAEVSNENFKVALHLNFPDQEVVIGGTISAKGRTELCSLLKKNLDIFAWQASNMTGVPRSIAEHRLNIREGYSPVRQKKMGKAPERAKAIQAEMAESDEEKTTFHTSQGVYCYTKMPFGLKNAGATYQRLVDKAFNSQVGRNIEVYVDDLVIKSHTKREMLRDIDETFHTLQKINIKLNPKKFTFGAVEGMFLGYMISLEGIKPCLDKTEAVLQLPSDTSLQATEAALVEATPTGSTQTKGRTDWPRTKLYPNGKASPNTGFRSHWLRRYFQAHPIAVITDQPMKQIISRPDVAGRLQKWSVMLGEHNITYRPRTSVKGQILADFLVEKPDEAPPNTSVIEIPQESWTLFTDGSACVDGSGAGLILTSPEGTEFTYALRFQFTASNNKAEYESLITGLRIAAQMRVLNVHVSVDSKLVANQVLGTYVAKEENMVKYLEKAKSLISGFANFSISQVPRSKNKKADALSKIASTSFGHVSKQVLVEVPKEKSIQEEEVATVVKEVGPTWMTPIMEYLKDRTLLGDRKEANKLCINARQYELLEGVVYKRSFLKQWLRTMVRGGQGHVIGILLANHASRPGPFPEGPGKVKFLIVAMDYFTKWIEAKAVATIIGNHVKKFVWDNIVCRFGLPGEIVSDNVKHSQSNGLVQRANQSLGEGIKARLGEGNKNWIEELPHVLWSRSLNNRSNLLKERHERAAIREAKAKLKMTNLAQSVKDLMKSWKRGKEMDRCSFGCGSSSLSAASVCVAASANKIASP